jgi:hypothetical protein
MRANKNIDQTHHTHTHTHTCTHGFAPQFPHEKTIPFFAIFLSHQSRHVLVEVGACEHGVLGCQEYANNTLTAMKNGSRNRQAHNERHTQAGAENAFRIRDNHLGIVNELWTNHVVDAWRKRKKGQEPRAHDGGVWMRTQSSWIATAVFSLGGTHQRTHCVSTPNSAWHE